MIKCFSSPCHVLSARIQTRLDFPALSHSAQGNGIRNTCSVSITHTHTYTLMHTHNEFSHTYMEKTYLGESFFSGPCQVSETFSQ